MSLLLPSGFRKQFSCSLGHGTLTEDEAYPESYYCVQCERQAAERAEVIEHLRQHSH